MEKYYNSIHVSGDSGKTSVLVLLDQRAALDTVDQGCQTQNLEGRHPAKFFRDPADYLDQVWFAKEKLKWPVNWKTCRTGV